MDVDVLGYPGNYTLKSLESEYKSDGIRDMATAFDTAKKILPQRTLIVSYGKCKTKGPNPTYDLSAIGGMSGGPVVRNGKAVGMFLK
jgi:hypothetical protein